MSKCSYYFCVTLLRHLFVNTPYSNSITSLGADLNWSKCFFCPQHHVTSISHPSHHLFSSFCLALGSNWVHWQMIGCLQKKIWKNNYLKARLHVCAALVKLDTLNFISSCLLWENIINTDIELVFYFFFLIHEVLCLRFLYHKYSFE